MMMAMLRSVTNFAAAACSNSDPGFFGFPTWYQYLKPHVVTIPSVPPGGPTTSVCTVDFLFPSSIPLIGLAVVDILLRIAAIIAVGFVVYGGIKFTLSQGEPQATANARETIIGALAGLAIATAASAIIAFIGNKIGGPV